MLIYIITIYLLKIITSFTFNKIHLIIIENSPLVALATLAHQTLGALAKPGRPSAKESVITITVDEFHTNSNSDNGLKLSNGTSPSLSANKNSESETHKKCNESSLTHSYSEVFMNNDSYIAPGADMLLDPNIYDAESGKIAING